jgi:hypothetical protein
VVKNAIAPFSARKEFERLMRLYEPWEEAEGWLSYRSSLEAAIPLGLGLSKCEAEGAIEALQRAGVSGPFEMQACDPRSTMAMALEWGVLELVRALLAERAWSGFDVHVNAYALLVSFVIILMSGTIAFGTKFPQRVR